MASWTVAVLAALSSFSQVLGEMLLPPPHNLTLVSKDFNLFLTWLPGAGYPPGVFYSVQWGNVYNAYNASKNFPPCRNISEAVCNITCTSSDLYHSYYVQVKAQAGTISSAWVKLESIESAVHVKLAPPVLQVRKIGDIISVNAAFSVPFCLEELFRDLTTDLEYWEAGTNNRKKIDMNTNNMKDFDATVFNSGNYCFSARANLKNEHSNFSEPTCVQLHNEADIWAFAAVPGLLLFILVVLIIFSLCWSKSRPVKSPQTLDFSSLKCPKMFLEFTEKEFITVLTCPGQPVVVENRSRFIPQIHSCSVPAVLEEYEEEEEDEEEDDTGSPRPYTEMCRFQKNDMHSQMVGLSDKGLDPCSESDSSQLGEGSMPDLMMPEFFVLTNSASGETTSLSAGSSSEESSICPGSYLASRREEQGDLNAGFLCQLYDCNLPTGKLLVPLESFREDSCGTLGDPQISLFGVQSSQDFCGLFLEDENLSENDSCGYGRYMAELSPLKVPSREGLENSMLGGNRSCIADSSPKYHGYQPRPVHCLSRILPG